MISFDHNAIFIRVPKTASTSVATALNCLEVGAPHRNIGEVRQTIDALRQAGRAPEGADLPIDWFDRYFKFGFVRNPWSRTVSLYRRQEGRVLSEQMSFEEFVDWIGFASDTCLHPSRHRNQLDWFTDSDGNVLVDHIGKFETLGADWRLISERLSVDMPLPHLNDNPARQTHYTDYYTDSTRDIIGSKFAVDIDYFGYRFGD